jgi:PAS domain S-box-containing protein
MEPRQLDRLAEWGRRRFDSAVPVLGAPRVLLVEPHDETRLLYTCLFEDAGYAVHGVSDGIVAIGVARHRLPDIVVMLMAVSAVDGFEILHQLREDPLTSSIPAVVVLVLEGSTGPETLLAEVEELILAAPRDRAAIRRLRRSLLTLRELAKRVKPDDRAQQRMRALIDRLQVAILALDEQGRYVAVSRGASTLTGYSRAELLNMAGSDSEFSSDQFPSRPWQEFLTDHQTAAGSTLRDKSGTIVNVHTAFATLLPGLHAAAFAISEHAADHQP